MGMTHFNQSWTFDRTIIIIIKITSLTKRYSIRHKLTYIHVMNANVIM